jgi:hypothetical protein
MSVIRQLSLFGVEASPPEPGDLAGLVIAGGEVTLGPAGAQVSVAVDHPWRAAALVAECARRGLAATSVAAVGALTTVRTEFSPRLVTLAQAWEGGRAPRGFLLDGRALRLWLIARGHPGAGRSIELPFGDLDEPGREAIGAALAAVGIGAVLVTARGGAGHSYRIVGQRRLARLAEMVGDAPKQAPADSWPS